MRPIVSLGIGVAAGVAATYGTARLLGDEHVPTKAAPAIAGTALATAAGAGAVLARSTGARWGLAAAAGASLLTGGALHLRPQLLWNTQGGLLDGAYDPERLPIQNPHVRVTGTVAHVGFPDDGDVHIDVIPDKPYDRYVRPNGRSGRIGKRLVVEPVPKDQGRLPLPHEGDRVAVEGPLVWDATHGWSEIHPAKSIEILEADGPRPPRPRPAGEPPAIERERERNRLIGGGLALAGLALVGVGVARGVSYYRAAGTANTLGSLAGDTRPWRQMIYLGAAGSAALLGGTFLAGVERD
jgi:hypothetical protein